ncbi:MAG: peptide-methionine (S)-S-oxide reductase MsrA [Gammaproteobacteria bacterium]
MKIETAVFAGGCFWCMQPPFDKADGVLETVAGYTGGVTENPDYESVSGGKTGHYEAVEITYDPERISYRELLKIFWRNIDPTDGRGQFCDKGNQYRSAIFYSNEAEKQQAEASKRELENNRFSLGAVQTEILAAKDFFPAEDYHQSYYLKNPFTYKTYRYFCGRDSRLEEIWNR